MTPPPSPVKIAIELEKRYGVTFTFCNWGTKDTGHEKDWPDKPYSAEQFREKYNIRPRNLKVLTGPKSRCIALDADKPETVNYYLSRLDENTFRVKTSRGKGWLFELPSDLTFTKIVLPDGAEVMSDRHTRTVAGKHPSGVLYEIEVMPDKLTPIPDWLLQQIKAEIDKKCIAAERARARAIEPLEGDLELAATALNYLDPDMPHDEWVAIGMALHDLDPVGGLDLWDQWSARGSKYKPGLCALKWRSFKRGAITRGTLFHAADVAQPGWRPAPIRTRRTVAPFRPEHKEPVEPSAITVRLAAEINRYFQHQADAVLEVYRAAIRYFRNVAFTARQLMERSGLGKAIVHRGLMYGRNFIFSRQAENPDAVNLVAVCAPDSIDDSKDLSLLEEDRLQSATKSMPPGSRPPFYWRLRPYADIVRTMCYEVFYVDLERSLEYKLATVSRIRDLHGDPSYVGRINRTLQKWMSIVEQVEEREKLKKMALKIRLLRHDLLNDLTPVGEGHHQTGECAEKSVRLLMVEEWHLERNGTDRTFDCENVLGMAKTTVQRMGRAVGFRWQPQTEEQIIRNGHELPVPGKWNMQAHAFPRTVIVSGRRTPYSSAQSVAERMEVLHVPAVIEWQKGSKIVYDPDEAALDADYRREKAKDRAAKPVKGSCAAVGEEMPEWNYQGNPPNWTRANWAYYWLKRMGYQGDYDDLTNAQILEMLSTDRGSLRGEALINR